MSAAANSVRSVSSRLAPSGRSTTTCDLGLVVERQQLDRDGLGRRTARSDSSVATPTPSRKIQAERLLRDDRRGDAPVERARARLRRAPREPCAAAPSSARAAASARARPPWRRRTRTASPPRRWPGSAPYRGPSARRRTASAAAPRPPSASRRWSDCRPRRPPRSRPAGAARPSLIAQWRAMFSTTTMASSTRMPIEKISANRLTRLMV